MRGLVVLSASLKEARYSSENKMSLKRFTEYEVNNVEEKANQVLEDDDALAKNIGLIEEDETDMYRVFKVYRIIYC